MSTPVRLWTHAVALAAAALLLTSVAGDAATVSSPTVRWVSCAVADLTARCGTLSVPENRATRAGRTIELNVTVIPAQGGRRLPDPIFWLSGGPGGAATEEAATAVEVFRTANVDRDLVFVDQRGTGGSHPMSCRVGSDPARLADDLRSCLPTLDGDAWAYTSAWAADDLDDVRAALGYQSVNLYGGSYGGTMVQVYAQRHPDRTRTATMISGTLLEVAIFELMPRNSQQAMAQVFARCAADPACHAAFPDPAGDLRALVARLERGPVDLRLTDPATNQPVRATLAQLAPALHSLLLNAQTAALLPRVVHTASRGDWSVVTDLIRANQSTVDEPMLQLMPLAIMCQEPWAMLRPGTTTVAGRGYLGYADVRAMVGREDVCAAMPAPAPAAVYAPPTVVRVPLLMVNGTADPQDPPENVADAGRTYPVSLALTVAGQGHSIPATPCLISIVTAFIDSASPHGLPTDCLLAWQPPAFDVG